MTTQVRIALLPATGCAPMESIGASAGGASAAESAVLYWDTLPGEQRSAEAEPVDGGKDIVEVPGRSCTFITAARDWAQHVA